MTMGDDKMWDGGEELVFDEDDGGGVHALDERKGNIRIKEAGVEIEIDCPQCDVSRSLELSWRDVVFLGYGLPVKPLHAQRGGLGFVAYVPCDQCAQRLQEHGDPQARKHSTTVLELSKAELQGWARQGHAAGLVNPQLIQSAKHAIRAKAGAPRLVRRRRAR